MVEVVKAAEELRRDVQPGSIAMQVQIEERAHPVDRMTPQRRVERHEQANGNRHADGHGPQGAAVSIQNGPHREGQGGQPAGELGA